MYNMLIRDKIKVTAQFLPISGNFAKSSHAFKGQPSTFRGK